MLTCFLGNKIHLKYVSREIAYTHLAQKKFMWKNVNGNPSENFTCYSIKVNALLKGYSKFNKLHLKTQDNVNVTCTVNM